MKPPKQKKARQLEEKQTQLHNPHRPIIKDLLWFSFVTTFFKILLIPAYHSTDFEVHRNWLALTHTLPLSQWYTDETSPWTLDYPPFFAYFEQFLSFFASLVDPTITDLYDGLNYKALSVIIFQRLIQWVSLRDFVGFIGALQRGNDLIGGFVFAILLCFKHLFAVAGPVYFVYLLRHYCRGGILRGFSKLVTMGVVVVGVFVAAYGPFAYHGQVICLFLLACHIIILAVTLIPEIVAILSGLCHAYWAPNFWVFYILSDKLLAFVLAKFGFHIQAPTASFTGGLVGDSSPFAILPTITPSVTFAVVLLAISPCLVKAWRNPQPKMIIRWVAYAYSCGFLFGWHVHEKASLHFVVPLAVVAVESIEDARHYFILSIVSSYSLFPLLYEAQEYPIKVVLLLLHIALMWYGFSSQFSERVESDKRRTSVSIVTGWMEKSYLFGFVVVEIWGQFLHPFLLGDKLPFLPLMMMSFYCALGMMYSWIWQLRCIVRSH
ncbi:hypothetical protein OSB04_021818 [Centaurea solstitialis]|uniref:Alpha-1,3-glucosyltransferase n=1 Tax=Centaurea solstitialis TaxID=347529 RepID=A0AA38WEJ0_9ASTR|nr:hypothetical protein OSB04_021818 [Centaurea solstitialis]